MCLQGFLWHKVKLGNRGSLITVTASLLEERFIKFAFGAIESHLLLASLALIEKQPG